MKTKVFLIVVMDSASIQVGYVMDQASFVMLAGVLIVTTVPMKV